MKMPVIPEGSVVLARVLPRTSDFLRAPLRDLYGLGGRPAAQQAMKMPVIPEGSVRRQAPADTTRGRNGRLRRGDRQY
jgi:hypothetical protein